MLLRDLVEALLKVQYFAQIDEDILTFWRILKSLKKNFWLSFLIIQNVKNSFLILLKTF